MGLDSGPWAHGLLLGGVIELGDPTFFVTIVLTAWCPFQGLRSMRGATLQRLCVFLGAAAAISLRIVFVEHALNMVLADSVMGCIAAALFLVMGFRSLYEFWSNKEDAESSKLDPEAQRRRKGSYEATTFMGQERLRKALLPLAFFSAALLTYVALPNGRWNEYLLSGEPPSKMFAVGAGLGFGAATLLAIFLGSLMQAMAREQRMRFMITCTLWALVLWHGSFVFAHFHDDYLAKNWRHKHYGSAASGEGVKTDIGKP
jgi:putative Ca2+/H+ antiporter (TMEM165/GDT1 family)